MPQLSGDAAKQINKACRWIEDGAVIFRRLLPATLLTALIAAGGTASAQAGASVAPPAMQRWAPGLAQDTDAILFGDVWRRVELSPRDRSLVTISVLIATGKTPQLRGHLGRALDNGITPTEVAGVVNQLGWYSGWPNAVSALQVIDEVMAERGITPDAVRRGGEPLPLPPSDADRARSVRDSVAPTAPKLAELTNDVLFADLWRRQDLTVRDRSLATIAALTANGDTDQLGFHIPRGIENGLTRPKIAEVLTHLAFYAGWPKAMAAVAVLRDTSPGTKEVGVDPLMIVPPGQAPQAGPAARFTGAVAISSPFGGSGASCLGGATVTFQPGARSNWHTHPLGQLLVVTDGEGRIQAEGDPVKVIRAGDLVWTAPGVRHWHGAAPDSAMTHVAISEAIDGQSVSWQEAVTDTEYDGALAR